MLKVPDQLVTPCVGINPPQGKEGKIKDIRLISLAKGVKAPVEVAAHYEIKLSDPKS